MSHHSKAHAQGELQRAKDNNKKELHNLDVQIKKKAWELKEQVT